MLNEDEVVVLGVNTIRGEEKEPGLIVKLLATGENVSLSLLEAEPGTIFEIHDHEEEELCYIPQGRGVLTVEEKTYEIVAPVVVRIPPNLRHGLLVTGTKTLLKLNAHSPPRNTALKKK